MNQMLLLFAAFKRYPVSIIAYVITLAHWLMLIVLKIRIWINPPTTEQNVAVGEGLMYGVLLSTFLSAVLLLITLINLSILKDKKFYLRFFMLNLLGVLVFYAILWI